MINLHKHTCRSKDCQATASLLGYDGVCAYYLCASCTNRAVFRRHIRQHGGGTVPAAITVCREGCEG